MLLAIGLIVADHRYRHLDPVRSVLSIVVAYPVHYTADLSDTLTRKMRGRLAKGEKLRRDKKALNDENLKLKARLQQFDKLEEENLRLRNLLGSSLKIGDQVLVAEIMAVELDSSRQQVMIDRGTSSGVFLGQPVLNADAVMGQVIRVGPLSATVLLITDTSHGLPVRVRRNGFLAVAQGTGTIDRLKLFHLPRNADVRVGDLLTTSGLASHFPPGYPVARVTDVQQPSDGSFVTVIAEPTVPLDRSREVLLVWTLPPILPDGNSTEQPTGEDVRELPRASLHATGPARS